MDGNIEVRGHQRGRGVRVRRGGGLIRSIVFLYLEYFILYCICIFCRTERLPRRGGRDRVLSAEQETAIVNMVLENNAITFKKIQCC